MLCCLLSACSGNTENCPPPTASTEKLSWFDALSRFNVYSGIPISIVNTLDDNESEGYWVDIARNRWYSIYHGKFYLKFCPSDVAMNLFLRLDNTLHWRPVIATRILRSDQCPKLGKFLTGHSENLYQNLVNCDWLQCIFEDC